MYQDEHIVSAIDELLGYSDAFVKLITANYALIKI